MKYITRITRLTVLPEKEPIFSEAATHIEIDDASGGEYIKVTQESGNADAGKSVLINDDEWPAIRDAIETMFAEIRKAEA